MTPIFSSITVTIISADLWHTLRALSDNSITIIRLELIDELSASLTIRSRDYQKLNRILKKHGAKIRSVRISGQSAFLHTLQKRPLPLLGFFFILFLTLFLPTRTFFIRVEGNSAIPDARIIEAAEKSGLFFGMKRSDIRSEKIKNSLLSEIPALQWAGVNTIGVKAIIAVTERTIKDDKKEISGQISSIVAEQDGIIEALTVKRGTAQCTQGDIVRKGQLLISGYTDCGIYLRGCRASGEVYANTVRKLDILSPIRIAARGRDGQRHIQLSLRIGKKRINLWKDSGIYTNTCDRIDKEYCLKLPGGYLLPISVIFETRTDSTVYMHDEPEDLIREAQIRYADQYLTSQMISGTIHKRDITYSVQSDAALLTARYRCTEMIGREHLEKIGDQNGKNN